MVNIPGPQLAVPTRGHYQSEFLYGVALVAVAGVAFSARLVPLLRGGGFYGLGNYDDGVYYAAATALVHGQLPYRDFLLLQPPGITVVLAPFAFVGLMSTDADGFATARLAWMLLGAANSVLVVRILRPLGLAGALTGGLVYAVFYPAVYSEHTTLLEAPANTALLGALALIGRSLTGDGRKQHRRTWLLLAGAMIGVSAGIKIWGVVVIVLIVGWVLASRGLGNAQWVAVGAGVGGAASYLPFFVDSPLSMWHEVVRDQLGRDNGSVSSATRLAYLTGLGSYHPARPSLWMVAMAVALLLVAMALAWRTYQTRLAVVLLIGLTGLLLVTPTWFSHYAALIAPPVAVVTGAATAHVWHRARTAPTRFRANLEIALMGTASLVGLGVYTFPLVHSAWGQPFPADAFSSAVAAAPGCVTADDPTALIETNVLSRNLQRGCGTVVDLAGYSHDFRAAVGSTDTRLHNKAWQQYGVEYLRSGSAAFILRFDDGSHFDVRSRRILGRWPLLAQSGGFELRSPPR